MSKVIEESGKVNKAHCRFWQDFSQLDINLEKPIKNGEEEIESQSSYGFLGECTPSSAEFSKRHRQAVSTEKLV